MVQTPGMFGFSRTRSCDIVHEAKCKVSFFTTFHCPIISKYVSSNQNVGGDLKKKLVGLEANPLNFDYGFGFVVTAKRWNSFESDHALDLKKMWMNDFLIRCCMEAVLLYKKNYQSQCNCAVRKRLQFFLEKKLGKAVYWNWSSWVQKRECAMLNPTYITRRPTRWTYFSLFSL